MMLKSALINAAREIERMADLARNIDEAVGSVSVSGGEFPLPQAITLQQVDLLRQSLECMTQFIGQIADQADDAHLVCVETAVQGIPLKDLAASLRGHALVPQDTEDTHFF